MGAENILTAQLTNRDAAPQVLNDPGVCGAFIRSLMDTLTSTTGVTSPSTYRFFQVPSNAVITKLVMWTAALSTSVVLDIGIYDTTLNGGAAVTDNLFATGVDASSAIAGTDYRFSALSPNTAGQQLWKLLSLASDPAKMYDLVVTADATMTAGGYITLHCSYGQ